MELGGLQLPLVGIRHIPFTWLDQRGHGVRAESSMAGLDSASVPDATCSATVAADFIPVLRDRVLEARSVRAVFVLHGLSLARGAALGEYAWS